MKYRIEEQPQYKRKTFADLNIGDVFTFNGPHEPIISINIKITDTSYFRVTANQLITNATPDSVAWPLNAEILVSGFKAFE